MIDNYGKFTEFYDETSIKLINTPSKHAKSAFFYVQEVGRITAIKPHTSTREMLDSYLFVMVEKGSGFLTYDGITYHVRAGECFFVDCRKTYAQGSDSQTPWVISWVHFYGATSQQYYDMFRKSQVPVFTPNQFDDCQELLMQLLHKTKNKTAHGELECSLHIVELLTHLLSTKKTTGTPKRPMVVKCQAIKEYLDEHYVDAINLDSLASEFYISKYYMTREFKNLYGQSIIEYALSKRITLAKQLLRYTNGSINDIALECGFHDQGYFNKQFKKAEHITGKEYRKQWR